MTSASFEMPVTVNRSINTACVYNNRIYFQAGQRGEWYITDGTSIAPISRLPYTLVAGYITAKFATVYNDLIYFGLSTGATKNGIFSLNPNTNAINFEYVLSPGEGMDTINSICGLGESDNTLLVGWNEGSTYGVDARSTSRYSSDAAFLVSQFYRVGTAYSKRAFQEVDIQLSKPMASGDGVSVWYRTAQNASWTSVGTMTYAADGAIQSKVLPFGISVESVQFKVSLNDEAELIDVTIR
jgi:hypothetical protein